MNPQQIAHQIEELKNRWMFYGSDNGGRTAAVLTSFITTCKRLGIDSFAYLRQIFERISTFPASRLAELLPDKWLAGKPAVNQLGD